MKYHSRKHQQLPHIVKFSGGRSSALMLMQLLDSDTLKSSRGDLVLFNNTTAEHPETYRFTAVCKEMAEAAGIPFLWTEWTTYETQDRGIWVRRGTYRLVNSTPHSEENPAGYRVDGSSFEAVVSLDGFLPHVFARTCTLKMKISATAQLLAEWLTGQQTTAPAGTPGGPRITDADVLERYRRNGGKLFTPARLLDVKSFIRQQAPYRPGQAFADFTRMPDSRQASSDYLALVGFRADEPHRVARMNGLPTQHPGEFSYAPLADAGIVSSDVLKYWEGQNFDLALPPHKQLSNCVFCFLKTKALPHIADQQRRDPEAQPGTPQDLSWWLRLEQQYGKDSTRTPGTRWGFFAANSGRSYRMLIATDGADLTTAQLFDDDPLPCECTD